MGGVCAKSTKSGAGSRRLSVTNMPGVEDKLPPNETIVGEFTSGNMKLRYAAVSLPGTYFHPSVNPFKGNTKYKTNQDSYFVSASLAGDNKHYFGVLDGHGQVGHEASQLAARELVATLKERAAMLDNSAEDALFQSFVEVDQRLKESVVDVMMSGTTAVSCFLSGNDIFCANCGDSRCVVAYIKDGELEVEDLSDDHKPDLPEEKKRIEASGGRVAPLSSWPDGPHRVWLKTEPMPGLAMSRSLGDRVAHSVGVSAEPEIKRYKLDVERDRFLILASDGVWEFISSEQAVNIVSMVPDPKEAASALCKEAVARWQVEESVCDDITALVIMLSPAS